MGLTYQSGMDKIIEEYTGGEGALYNIYTFAKNNRRLLINITVTTILLSSFYVPFMPGASA